MGRTIACVPNFSEGRRQFVLDELAKAAQSVQGIVLKDYSADETHNRSVYTLVGEPEAVLESVFQMCRVVVQHIDMNRHTGEHPRMGAVDVIPLIPLRGVTMSDCVKLSSGLASRVWEEFKIPVFLYGNSAQFDERQRLERIRAGQFEGMPEKLLREEWKPDFGERSIHPTAGVMAIGARNPLIAFNINLGTGDLGVAKRIAVKIRESSGGLKCVKAIAIPYNDKEMVQVSMNLTDFTVTPIHKVFDLVSELAESEGVRVKGSEIIGVPPAAAMLDCAAHYLKLDDNPKVLENLYIS